MFEGIYGAAYVPLTAKDLNVLLCRYVVTGIIILTLK